MEDLLFGDSPFVDVNELPVEKKILNVPDIKNTINTETDIRNAQKIREMYQNRPNLLKSILKIYKFIFKPMRKQLYEKTEKDITDDVMSAKFNMDLDKFVKESYAEILNNKNSDKLLFSKISLIPVFLDFCFIYYAHYFDEEAPFYKLPNTIFKFKLVSSSLNKNNPIYTAIDKTFEEIILDETVKDMRIESPPYYLRNSLPTGELKNKITNHINPIFKKLMNLLLSSLKEKNNIKLLDYNLDTSVDIDLSSRLDNLASNTTDL